MGLFDGFKNKNNDLKIDYSNHPLHYKFLQGENCDEVSHGYGDFGRTPTNPIPVYGPKGLIIYLNRLRTSQGQPFFFHKITYTVTNGLPEGVDTFEIVAVDGSIWDILYFHIYHPRNSEKAPVKLVLKNDDSIFSKLPIGLGINEFDPIFPYNIGILADKFYGKEFGVSSVAEKFLRATTLFRPQEQIIKVIHVNNIGKVFNKLVQGSANFYPQNYFLNLLESSDLYAHVFALMCLESRKTVSDNILISLARYCYKIRDNAANELVINIIKRHFPDLHELHCNHIKYYDIKPIPAMVLMLIKPFYNTVSEGKTYLSAVPYLKQLALHQYTDLQLRNYCNNKIEEIIVSQ